MTLTRKLFLLLAILSVLPLSAGSIIPGAAPPPDCAAGSLASYIGLGSRGCSVDQFRYSDFDFGVLYSSTNNPATLIASESTITISPPASILESIQIRSDLFSVAAGDRVVYLFHYLIDPPPPILPGYDMEMFTETPVAPGLAKAQAFLCPGGVGQPQFGGSPALVTSLLCASFQEQVFISPYVLNVFHNGGLTGNQLSDGTIFANPTNQVDVWIQLDLDARNGGSSQIKGIGNNVPYLADEPVPEPGSLVLLGAGLSALSLLRRRR